MNPSLEVQYMAELESLMDALSVQEQAAGRGVIEGVIPPLARLLALLFLKDDGTVWNHIGWQIGGAPDPIGLLELVVQRVDGESPLQQRDQANAEAARMRPVIDAVRQWRDAVHELNGIASAERALLVALDAHDVARWTQTKQEPQ
jgi:hypothetical protein